ncbi:MAG: hypothetical protein NC253_03155 [Ruminococcus sp.]|nr:hypothetical protein [Ruminococcus sp.]MCM1478297.1 hypothetical protein [Muribaculaceae bacterium]
MKRLARVFLGTVTALSLAGCGGTSANSETVSETASETVQTTTEITETAAETERTSPQTTTVRKKVTVTESSAETTRETVAPAELEGDYLEWARAASETVYRFLKEDRYHANAPDMYRFDFVDLNFDGVPEITLFDGGQWGGTMAACTLEGDLLYNYYSAAYKDYIAAVDSETGEKVMLFETSGGHGFVGYRMVYALTDEVIEFREDITYEYDSDGNGSISGSAFSVSKINPNGEFGRMLHDPEDITDLIEQGNDGDELYQKYFGKYEELYRINSGTKMIEVPDSEDYTLDDVYACVLRVMEEYKEYSENLPQN